MKKSVLLISMIIAFFLTTLNSCEKENDHGSVVDNKIDILVLDKQGNNLLNPSNPNAYNLNDIKLFYLEDGEITEVYFGNRTYPRNFYVVEELNYQIRLFANLSKEEVFPTTYIQWDESDMDTIKCEVFYTGRAAIINKVWYNNVLKWTAYDTDRYFEVIKQK